MRSGTERAGYGCFILTIWRWIAGYPATYRNRFGLINCWMCTRNGSRVCTWNALYLENHDQPRIVSHYGDDRRYWDRSAKLLATLQLTLRGTPFLYEGQEIGMTNFDFQSMRELKDVESFNVDRLMKSKHIPKWLRWRFGFGFLPGITREPPCSGRRD